MNLQKNHNLHRLSFLFIFLLVLLHLPFLLTDPDGLLSFSRGIFTDEGYYTIQLRNWLNHGHWGYWDVDAFVKTPLYNALLAFPMFLFGTDLMVARLTILSSAVLMLVVIARKLRQPLWIVLFCASILLLPQVFQFMRLALAEILGGMLLLTGISIIATGFPKNSSNEKILWQWLVVVEIIFALAYWGKNQFLYTVPLSPLLFLTAFLIWKSRSARHFVKLMTGLIAIKIFLLLLYFLLWYLPNKELYDFMLRSNESRLITDNYTGKIKFSVKHLFRLSELRHFFYLFFPVAIAGSFLAFFAKNKLHGFLLLAGWCWMAVEMHKFIFLHLPGRFLVTMLMAGGLVFTSSVFIMAKYFMQQKRPVIRWIALLPIFAALWIIITNVGYISSTWKNRTYILRETNEYLDRHLEKEEKTIGVWSASFNWQSKALAVPVTFNYHQKPFPEHYHPRLIFSEPDQNESNQLYNHYSIHLDALSDSVKSITLEEYRINLYWLNNWKKNE